MPTISVVASGFVPTARFTAERRGLEGLPILEIKGELHVQKNVEEQVFSQVKQIERALTLAAKLATA
ncbi:MAG: hypothetical protein HYX92_19390 [Chloroflexi bacterium]|nr:hypothetical protein [Chloroflexota bacterium]